MKQLITFLALIFIISGTTYGQVKFGAGLSLDDDADLGINARAKLNLQDRLDLVPMFTYWIVDGGNAFSVDALVNYHFADLGEMPIYGLGGLGITRFSSGDLSNSELSLSLGGGIIVKEQFYIETRWQNFFCDFCGSDLVFTGGYYF